MALEKIQSTLKQMKKTPLNIPLINDFNRVVAGTRNVMHQQDR